MGSEMCIRDRLRVEIPVLPGRLLGPLRRAGHARPHHGDGDGAACLLYTSDAADERSSVDLGGRRILTKKN